jgi:hypothetical protein
MGNQLFSFAYAPKKDSVDVLSYPDVVPEEAEGFEYLIQRANTSSAALLRATYNHLLWKGPPGIRHFKFAEQALTNYTTAIKDCVTLNAQRADDEFALRAGELFERTSALVAETGRGKSVIRELASYLLFEDPAFPFFAKHSVVSDMLDRPKLFSSEDFTNVLSLFEEQVNIKEGRADWGILVMFWIPTAIRIANKLQADVRTWHIELGNIYMLLAESERNEINQMIRASHLQKAVDAFMKGGDAERKIQAEKLYQEAKEGVRLDRIPITFTPELQTSLQMLHDASREAARSLLLKPPEEIYAAVARGLNFPSFAEASGMASRTGEPFLDAFTALHFDRNKNIRNNSDKAQEKLYESYGLYLQNTTLPFLHELFNDGIRSNKLNYRNAVEFFRDRTWIGKSHFRFDFAGQPEETNWLELIKPGLLDLFLQTLAAGSSRFYKPNYILAIDSLTLKFEGLLRNFCERLNFVTLVGRPQGIQEAYLHELLRDKKLQEKFNEDDRLFFEHLFLSGGLDLRNNIAHSFYRDVDYHQGIMLLLMAALLRLGKYDLKESKQT